MTKEEYKKLFLELKEEAQESLKQRDDYKEILFDEIREYLEKREIPLYKGNENLEWELLKETFGGEN